MSSKTREDMEMKYDEFHDSYHSPTNTEELKLSLDKVSELVRQFPSSLIYVWLQNVKQ